MPETDNSANVCYACKQRKKRCDKALPTCGFCNSHGLPCRYDLAAPRHDNGLRKYNPGKSFVLLLDPPTLGVPALAELTSGQSLVQPGLCCDAPSTLESAGLQVHSIIRLLQISPEDIGKRYFQTFHQLLPVISPQLFSEPLSKQRSDGSNLPPDFSVLLLAMCLVVTVRGLDDGTSQPSHPTRQHIYETTKVLLAKVQTAMLPSVRLVQAAILISLCEYASVRPEAAYVSIGTCIGLARILGIGQAFCASSNVQGDSAEIEKLNIAWGIAIVERIILCGLDQRDIQLITQYPCSDAPLPVDLKFLQSFETRQQLAIQPVNSATLSSPYVVKVDQFGRLAQTVSLLDQVLAFRHSVTTSSQRSLLELIELDSRIRGFLSVVMSEGGSNATTSGATIVALSLRSLFLLHNTIIDTPRILHVGFDDDTRYASIVALNSVSKMVVDAATWYSLGKGSVMPIYCYYNIRSAVKYMQGQNKIRRDQNLSFEIGFLLGLEERFCKQWLF